MWRRGLPGAAGLERERPRNCVPFRGCAGGLQGTTPVPAQGGAATREQAFALGPAPAARCTSDAVVAVTLQGRGGQREPRDLEQRKPPESPLQRDTCNVNSSRARRQPRRWGVRPKTAGRSPARGQDCRDAHRTRGPTPRPHAPAPRCRTSGSRLHPCGPWPASEGSGSGPPQTDQNWAPRLAVPLPPCQTHEASSQRTPGRGRGSLPPPQGLARLPRVGPGPALTRGPTLCLCAEHFLTKGSA